jgi:hypothetical protein
VVHWHRTSRSAVSDIRSGPGERCRRNLLAGRSDRMAYAFDEADVNRNGWRRLGSARTRKVWTGWNKSAMSSTKEVMIPAT